VPHEIRATWRKPPVVHPSGPAAAAVLLLILGGMLNSTVCVVGAMLVIVALGASRISPSLIPWIYPTHERGRLRIDSARDWLWNDGAIATSKRVTQAIVVPPVGDVPPILRVELRSGDCLEFEVALGEGRRFLEHARLDPTHSVATFMVASTAETNAWIAWSLVAAPFVFLGLAIRFENGALAIAAPVALLVLIVAFAVRTRVRVGADAIEWRWLLVRRRVAYRELATQRYGEGVIVFKRRSGKRSILRTGTNERNTAVHRRIVERLDRALMAHGRAVDAPKFDLATLDRQGESVESWIERLRALGSVSTTDYRAAPVDPAALLAIVDDVNVVPARRAAALIVGESALTHEARGALSARAKGMLNAELRAAIEAVLTADDRALRRAMDALMRE